LGTFQQLLSVADFRLVVVDSERRLVEPMTDLPHDARDRQGRRFPAHLDVILDPDTQGWWGHAMGIAHPPETFRRSRAERDWQRARYARHQRLYGR
jgi:hypothetical protein